MRLSVSGPRTDQVRVQVLTVDNYLIILQSGKFLILPCKLIARFLSVCTIPLVQMQSVRYSPLESKHSDFV